MPCGGGLFGQTCRRGEDSLETHTQVRHTCVRRSSNSDSNSKHTAAHTEAHTQRHTHSHTHTATHSHTHTAAHTQPHTHSHTQPHHKHRRVRQLQHTPSSVHVVPFSMGYTGPACPRWPAMCSGVMSWWSRALRLDRNCTSWYVAPRWPYNADRCNAVRPSWVCVPCPSMDKGVSYELSYTQHQTHGGTLSIILWSALFRSSSFTASA